MQKLDENPAEIRDSLLRKLSEIPTQIRTSKKWVNSYHWGGLKCTDMHSNVHINRLTSVEMYRTSSLWKDCHSRATNKKSVGCINTWWDDGSPCFNPLHRCESYVYFALINWDVICIRPIHLSCLCQLKPYMTVYG